MDNTMLELKDEIVKIFKTDEMIERLAESRSVQS